MVCTANDLQEWKDFPKGLRVLLLDGDTSSASEIRSKLEAMDYIVSTFCNETEALSAFSSNPECFHVAIIEVNASNEHWGFQFLETAKNLPIIMTSGSSSHCLSTMMKCIALGAVEFLRKPLSEDKLRNIWQHVVHKAFNAGGSVISESRKPVKESVVSMLQIKQENEADKCEILLETENVSRAHESDHEQSTGIDKYPAPSTPQLKQGSRLLDDGDCQDQTNCLSEKESGEPDGESKSVETTCANPISEETLQMSEAQMPLKIGVKEEDESADGSNLSSHQHNRSSANDIGDGANDIGHQHFRDSAIDIGHPPIRDSPNGIAHPHNRDSENNIGGAAEISSKASGPNHSCKSNRRKMKVDWTPELHKKFVRAVEQLGVDHAIPSRILELMKTEGLTRHNVASHLQKYRMNKRHILPKEDDRRLLHPRDPNQRSYYPQKPIMAFPPYHYNTSLPMAPAYPVWGSQPGSHPANIQMWGPPGYPQWQPSETWHWNPYPGMQADAWGCPVMPPLQAGYSSYPQNAPGPHNAGVVNNGCSMPHDSIDVHPADEVVDKVVKEAINKPWLPLPLGLKPPSTDGVLAELSRQGICNIPQINGPNTR